MTTELFLSAPQTMDDLIAEHGVGVRCQVIAEIGVNHDGSVEQAMDLIDAAHQAGADTVKFQTFRADKLASSSAPRARYQENGDDSDSQLEILRRLELSPDDFREISKHCDNVGIEFLSTPFDIDSAVFLCGLGVRRFKIGSGDLTNTLLLRKVASFRLPVILSTGMATNDEIDEALDVLDRGGAPDVALLHCISRYPTPVEDLQLLEIVRLRRTFDRRVGFSDHSVGCEAALVARALGACIIEKHLTLDRELSGPDHAASIDPDGLAELIRGLRLTESMLGTGQRVFHPEEQDVRDVARKSIVVSRPVREGEVLSADNLELLRPGTGIAPREWDALLGRRAACPIAAGEILSWDQVL
jgi:N-acetylneuraminate synthase